MRRLALLLVVLGLTAGAVGCRPGPPSAPTCNGNAAIAADILNAGWNQAPGWVQSRVLNVIVPRESGCDPCAFYPSHSDCSVWNPSTAKGLFELLGHDDLILAACPNPWGIVAWHDPTCNARAAWFLSGGGNLAPWGG